MINIKTFDLRNMWTLQSGEMAVRPGLRELFTTSTASQDNVFPLECFSVKNVFSDGIRHYVLADNQSQGYISLIVYDEEFLVQDEIRLLDSGTYVSRMDYALVNGEMIISGPELPTLWGYNGSGIRLAEKRESINPGLVEFDVPTGLCTAWAGRCVIAKGEALFISDPLAPQTYTADGIIPMPGHVYSLHTTEAGALVVVTTNGTYGLNPDAAAQGQGIVNVMQQLSDYSADDYNQTTIDGNMIWGLTRRGVTAVNAQQAGQEIALSDGVQDRVWSEMIDYPDYRSGAIYSTSHGIVVAIGSLTDYPLLGVGHEKTEVCGGFWIVDGSRGIKTWWTTPAYQLFAGTLFEREGDDMFSFQRRLPAQNPGPAVPAGTRMCVSKPYGNGVETIVYPPTSVAPDENVEVSAVAVGRVIYEPQASPTVRFIHTVSDNAGFNVHAAVEGTKGQGPKSIRISGETPLFDDPGTIIDPLNKLFKMPVMTGLRFGFAKRTRDVVPEVEFRGSRSRVGLLDVELKGIGKDRP